MKRSRERSGFGRWVTVGIIALATLTCCSSGGKRPGSDHVDSGDTETETAPLIEGEIPGWQMSWVLREGGAEICNMFYQDRGNAVAALPDESTYVTGYFSRTATFGEGDPVHDLPGSGIDLDERLPVRRPEPVPPERQAGRILESPDPRLLEHFPIRADPGKGLRAPGAESADGVIVRHIKLMALPVP